MPRTNGGTGPFVLNPIYLAIPGTTILATQHNTPLEDIEDTFNIPQPIAFGGTQASSPRAAMDNLFIVGADAISAGTLDLDNTTGTFVNITGTTTVTSVALAEGRIRYGRTNAALPFTASASLIVNGSSTASYTCEAGDVIMFVGYAAAIVRIWVIGRNKFIASQFKIADGTDQTKQVQFSASGLPTATIRTLDAPYYSGTLAAQSIGAAIASSATVNLAAATGETVHVTGTTTITSFGTVAAGIKRTIIFDGTLTLTHNATSLILPLGSNIVTAQNDVAEFLSEGSGNWRLLNYQRADIRAFPQYGSNTNGSFVRLQDGTQICYAASLSFGTVAITAGAIFQGTEITWTYPAAFTSTPAVSGNDLSSSNIWMTSGSVGTTTARLQLFSYTSIGSARSINAMAVGRWF